MARQITKELAVKIVNKLEAQLLSSSGAHDVYGIFHHDQLIASFGVRRGSEKDKGHDHIQSPIFVNSHFAKLLGQCPKSRADWLNELRKEGIIDDDELQEEPSRHDAESL